MPDARLYLLSESEFDDAFLRVIAARVTGWDFPCGYLRHACHHYSFTGINDDDETEMRNFFLTLRAKARTLGGDEPVFLIAVRDNDRGPFSADAGAPEAIYPSPLARVNRLRQLEFCRDSVHENDGHGPIFPCAVGISVQMIETWILLAHDPSLTEERLPIFPDKYQRTAKDHYAGQVVPPQLKNLYDTISSNARRQKRREFNQSIAEKADLASVSSRSPSFAAFVSELENLPKP